MEMEMKDRLEKVCVCKGTTKETIKNAIREGNDTVEKVATATGATEGACRGGRCRGKIEELITGFAQSEWQ